MLYGLEQRGAKIVEPRARGLAGFSYDILHLNFPTHHVTEAALFEAVFLTFVFASYLLAARLLGRTVVYTVHDVVPFRLRHGVLLRFCLYLTHRLSSGFVFLSQSSRDAFANCYPGETSKPWVLAPHGPYPSEILHPAERLRLRDQIAGQRPAFLVGFLGAIKPYKNIDALRSLPVELPDGRPVHVVVAGRAESGHAEEVAAVTQALPASGMTRIDRRLSDVELSHLIQAVDVVLLPYTKGSNSGAAMLVLSNLGRLIASDLPMFKELEQKLGRPWVYTLAPGGSERNDYRDLLLRAAEDVPADNERHRLSHFLHQVDWPNITFAIHDFYRALRRQRRRRRLPWLGRSRASGRETGAA